ncbi:ABC transporter ATP-binding protein [Actinosynnema sp. CA-248983]
MSDVVQVRGVAHRYGGVAALHEVDLNIRTGVTAVLGPNGAGKSTLLGLLSTALRKQRGSVSVEDVDSAREVQRYRSLIGFLPQTFTIPGNLTVKEFVTLAAWQKLVPRRDRGATVDAAIEAVDLSGRRDSKISRLSGGMHRRVGIAQAIVNRPRVLLLDEPTVGLDPRQRRSLRDLIPALGEDRAVVLSTHLTEDVAATADHIVVLDQGRVQFDGALDEFTGGRSPAAGQIDSAYEALVEMGDDR